ncbi:MFS transporter [Duganella sp.]|uniref:MFS transporter n=1 Tax=Duganella sp. TaxID=1904440 RepID=UPI0031CE8291
MTALARAAVPASAGTAPRGALARYVAAASLARMADGGAVVAVVLLATTRGDGGQVAGVLGACLTAPHLLGPFVARRIDLADDGRKIIALACLLYAAALAAAVATYGRVPLALTGLLLALAGLCGPLLTGGISTRLPAIAGCGADLRRAQGWDVATYGIGGTVGPSMVAAVSAWGSPALAAHCLAAATFLAAGLVMRLPYAAPGHGGNPQAVPGAWRTIALIAGNGKLRRTLYMTVLVAFCMAALPITAVQMTGRLGIPLAGAAAMTAAYGIGNLSGSVGVMLRPLRGSPDRLMTRLALCAASGLCAIMLSDGWQLAVCLFWIAGVANAFFFAATLAARTEYAPANARGQIFLWVAALKITAGSAGTASAGLLSSWDARTPLLAGTLLITTAAMLAYLPKRTSGLSLREELGRQRKV